MQRINLIDFLIGEAHRLDRRDKIKEHKKKAFKDMHEHKKYQDYPLVFKNRLV